jgi:hypothetical protein
MPNYFGIWDCIPTFPTAWVYWTTCPYTQILGHMFVWSSSVGVG